jgi:hypothetical protein
MRGRSFAAVVACAFALGAVPVTAASTSTSTSIRTNTSTSTSPTLSTGTTSTPTTSTSQVTDFQVHPTSIGTPGDAGGWCVLTSGQPFQSNTVWTCYVALISNLPTPVQWTAVGPTPTSCGGAAWMCKTTFSPSSGTLAPGPWRGAWVKIMTAIYGCGNYTLSFKTAHTTVYVPVLCG